jgi:micrococcal nuclease
VLVILLALAGLAPEDTERMLSRLTDTDLGEYAVLEVADGDTIVVDMDGRAETVRLIGLDTPEKNHPEKPVQCFAQAASDNLAMLIGFSPVRLEADPLSQNRDRYNRLLRYVYLPDGTLLNAKQIEQGFAFAYTGFPFSKSAEFIRLEVEAEAAGRGLWNACDVRLEDGFIGTQPA